MIYVYDWQGRELDRAGLPLFYQRLRKLSNINTNDAKRFERPWKKLKTIFFKIRESVREVN
jgi:hypothetical protein